MDCIACGASGDSKKYRLCPVCNGAGAVFCDGSDKPDHPSIGCDDCWKEHNERLEAFYVSELQKAKHEREQAA